jgi:PAS domain S-box-containing protein
MQSEKTLPDPQDLRRCNRDLVALSSLPAIWRSYTSQEIADSVASALLPMLDAELVFVSLGLQHGGGTVEAARTRSTASSRLNARVRRALYETAAGWRLGETAVIPNPIGDGTLHLAMALIGDEDGSFLIVASRRSGFPTDVQKPILVMAANETAFGLHRWRIEREERRFAAVVENSPDFIGISSLDGVALYVNAAGLEFVGLVGLTTARPMRVVDFVAPEERRRLVEEVWPTVIEKGRWAGELRFRHLGDGSAIPFLMKAFRIDDPYIGGPMNVATVGRDLTVQKEVEDYRRHLNETLEQRVSLGATELAYTNHKLIQEMEERNHADRRSQNLQLELFYAARLSTVGQMAGALAHELNQPLTAAANFLNAARRGLGDENPEDMDMVREDMEDAVEQIVRAGQIIRRLREFAQRGETGK